MKCPSGGCGSDLAGVTKDKRWSGRVVKPDSKKTVLVPVGRCPPLGGRTSRGRNSDLDAWEATREVEGKRHLWRDKRHIAVSVMREACKMGNP